MSRIALIALAMSVTSVAEAASVSLKENNLQQLLNNVARQSSVGTPRAINSDLLDNGYTVQGTELINHISVRPVHAEEMRKNPETVRTQLSASVCNNGGFRQLLEQGATLRYEFTEYENNKPVANEIFTHKDCGF